jgi:hypothetical protein
VFGVLERFGEPRELSYTDWGAFRFLGEVGKKVDERAGVAATHSAGSYTMNPSANLSPPTSHMPLSFLLMVSGLFPISSTSSWITSVSVLMPFLAFDSGTARM